MIQKNNGSNKKNLMTLQIVLNFQEKTWWNINKNLKERNDYYKNKKKKNKRNNNKMITHLLEI